MTDNQKDFFKGKIAVKIVNEGQCERLIQIVEEKGLNTDFADADDYVEFGYIIIDEDGDYTAVNKDYINYVSSKRDLTIMSFKEVFPEY